MAQKSTSSGGDAARGGPPGGGSTGQNGSAEGAGSMGTQTAPITGPNGAGTGTAIGGRTWAGSGGGGGGGNSWADSADDTNAITPIANRLRPASRLVMP